MIGSSAAMTPTLPKEVAKIIVEYVPFREDIVTDWANLVELKVNFQRFYQNFLHFWHLSLRNPNYTIVFDVIQEDFYED